MLFFFFCKISQQNVFNVILESEKAFLDYKNRKFKKSKKSGFFQRGQSMVLVKNLKFFSSFYCRLNRPGKLFVDILERKKAFF